MEIKISSVSSAFPIFQKIEVSRSMKLKQINKIVLFTTLFTFWLIGYVVLLFGQDSLHHEVQKITSASADSSLPDSTVPSLEESQFKNRNEDVKSRSESMLPGTTILKYTGLLLGLILTILTIVHISIKIYDYFSGKRKVKNYSPYLNTLIGKYSHYENYIDIELKAKTDSTFSADDESSSHLKLQELLKKGDRIQIFGKPGSGKTSALLKLLYLYSRSAVVQKSRRIPIYLEFRDTSFFDQIIHFFHSNNLVKRYSLLNEDWLREELAQGKFLILIDDIHKRIANNKKNEESKLVELLSYSKNQFILASRDYSRSDIHSFDIYEIAPLNEVTIRKILVFHTNEHDASEIFRQIRWPEALFDLYGTPQMLMFLSKVHLDNLVYNFRRIPTNKSAMFSIFLKMRDKHEAEKEPQNFNFPRIRNHLLGALAFYMISNSTKSEGYWVNENECLEVFLETNSTLKIGNLDPETLLEEILKEGFLIRYDDALRFEHDQWQEFFAAKEIFNKKLSLRDLRDYNSFNEIVYFVAGMHDYEASDADREYCDRFLKELIEIDFFIFAKCLRNFDKLRTLGEKRELFKDKSFSLSQIEKAYSDFLTCYSRMIDLYFSKLRHRFAPYTAEKSIGVIVEVCEGSMGHIEGFRKLELRNDKEIIIINKKKVVQLNQENQRDPNWDYYRENYKAVDLHMNAINPVLYELPIIAAFETIADKLKEILKNKNLVDPPELEQEKLYYETLAFRSHLYISPEQNDISVKNIFEGIVKSKIEKEIYQNFLNGTTLNLKTLRTEVERLFDEKYVPKETHSTTYCGLHSRKINDQEFEKRFHKCLQANNWNENDQIKPPLTPIEKKFKWKQQIHLTDEERKNLIEWSAEYHKKRLQNYKQLIEINFPSSKHSFETYKEFPIKIVLAIDYELPKNQLQFGERFLFSRMELQDEPVVVDIVDMKNVSMIEDKLYHHRWLYYPYWGIGSGTSDKEPLCNAIYELVRREYEELIG